METLEHVYDRFADTYDKARENFDTTVIFQDFQKQLTKQTGALLDLGCGAGEPVARLFTELGWDVTGVDISQKMLALARQRVPSLKTIHADIRTIRFEPNSFDACVACYSLFHIPCEEHQAVFGNVYTWLRPQGKAIFTYSTKEHTGQDTFSGYKEFLGESLFYSHETPEKLDALLKQTGFHIDSAVKRTVSGQTFLWVTVAKLQ